MIEEPQDVIKRGDRVSWRLDGQHRQFGRVIRMCTANYMPAYSVRDDDGIGRIIPRKFITKECG